MKLSTICYAVEGDFIWLALKKKGFGAGFYNGYGGKVRRGEIILQGLGREFLEESDASLDESSAKQVAIINFLEGEKELFECHIFFAYSWQGEFQETEEMGPAERFHKSNLPLDKMWKADRLWLPLLCAGKKIIATVVYKQGMEEVESFKYEELDEFKARM